MRKQINKGDKYLPEDGVEDTKALEKVRNGAADVQSAASAAAGSTAQTTTTTATRTSCFAGGGYGLVGERYRGTLAIT